MIKVLPYTLPDAVLFLVKSTRPGWMVWKPDKSIIVLGAANQAEKSIHAERVFSDNIPVYKRPSGGETVILTPKTLVISIRLIDAQLENPKKYFKLINEMIIDQLDRLNIKNLGQKGISDITIGNKKILGSSIFRKKEMIFYHSVLNVAESTETINHYLVHPSREPDYRKGRNHKDFVTSIHQEGYEIGLVDIQNILTTGLSEVFNPITHGSPDIAELLSL